MICLTPLLHRSAADTVWLRLLAGVALGLSLGAPARAVGPEDYARAEEMLGWNLRGRLLNLRVRPTWQPDGTFTYARGFSDRKEWLIVNPATGEVRTAFDHGRLAQAIAGGGGEPVRAGALPFDRFELEAARQRLRFDVGETRWTVDLGTYQGERHRPSWDAGALRYDPDERVGSDASLRGIPSPDGQWVAFVREGNLWVQSVATGKEIALTTDAVPYHDYAATPESNGAPVERKVKGIPFPPAVLWSPDSRRLLTHRLDQRQVRTHYLLQTIPPDGGPHAVLHGFRMASPGDEHVATVEYVCFDVPAQRRVDVKLPPQISASTTTPLQRGYVWWGPDGSKAYVVTRERGFKQLALVEIAPETGAVRTVLEERGDTPVDLAPGYYAAAPVVRIAGDELIWYSTRDGNGHLYLYDLATGKLKRQLTAGDWRVFAIKHVDERGRRVYFTAGGREPGRDPYYAHLYRTSFDGGQPELLTPEDLDHEIHFSPAGTCYVDNQARVDAVPAAYLCYTDGRPRQRLETGDLSALTGTPGWKWPEPFRTVARDGRTDIYGVLYYPANFDPARKYPILDYIYAGPQSRNTPKRFASENFDALALAQLGFFVIVMDGQGTPFRSRAFHDFGYGRMGDACGVADHISGLRDLASRRPYLDLARVGIYGHSGGGFGAAHAILSYPEFFKAAFASSGNYDDRGLQVNWGERYQGLVQGDNYDNLQTPLLAKNLAGKLFLATGDFDDQVQPWFTMQLVNALIDANKEFELMVFPGRFHSLSEDPYFVRLRWDFFVRELLGAAPPAGYRIRGPREK